MNKSEERILLRKIVEDMTEEQRCLLEQLLAEQRRKDAAENKEKTKNQGESHERAHL